MYSEVRGVGQGRVWRGLVACSPVKKSLFRFYKIESDTIFEKFSRFLNRSQLLPFFFSEVPRPGVKTLGF